jgi:FkbM family methyltransferase
MKSFSEYLEEALFVYPKRFKTYRRWAGKSALKFLFADLFRSCRRTEAVVGGQKLILRTFSSDLHVAADVFSKLEFKDVHLENPKHIIDAGANIGATSIYFSIKYPKAIIYAIEPELDTFDILSRNCQNFPNIVPINAALVGKDRVAKLYGTGGGFWGYSLLPLGGNSIEIQGVSINTLIEKYEIPRLDLLKMDIEGGEEEIMGCPEKWIQKTQSILIEIHDGVTAGASRSFYLATRDWSRFTKMGEKIFASKV